MSADPIDPAMAQFDAAMRSGPAVSEGELDVGVCMAINAYHENPTPENEQIARATFDAQIAMEIMDYESSEPTD